MKKVILCSIVVFTTLTLSAQSAKEKYKTSAAIVEQAIQKLKEGFANEANKLVDSAIAIYPTREVVDYAKELFLMANNNRAYYYLDKLYDAAASIQDESLLIFDPPHVKLFGRKQTLSTWRKWTGVFYLMDEAVNLNKTLGSKAYEISLKRRLTSFEIFKRDATARQIQHNYKIHLAIEEKDFEKALLLAREKDFSANTPDWVVSIYLQKRDYQNALQKINEYGRDRLGYYYTFLFQANAQLGNTEEALKAFKKISSKLDNNQDFYYLAIIELNRKNYDSALALLNKTRDFRLTGKYAAFAEGVLIERWILHKSYGDVYAGLKQYTKARDNYNISLLSHPTYEPAIEAMSKLEATIATTTTTDKEPPSITITEPSVKRGLQVTAAGIDVMVRGVAQDPSGLKSVTINDQVAYAQEGGNFWGNVSLKEGVNKITVKATDGAGNSAEQTIEVSKTVTPAPETDVIPVVAKEGKNYCLLIAAQNYRDAAIPSLDNPIQDAIKLKLILKANYNFTDENIITLFNPDANDIKRQLLELTNTVQSEDNLLIFYAGHGIWVEKEKKGYWLMSDSKRNDPNTWVSNKDVLNLIAKLPSRHTLLITDACFSGGVFKTRSVGSDASASIKLMDEKISRVAITSGNDTEVPDESVFMKYLVKALSNNKDKYMPAQKMFISHIMEAVMAETKTEPRYGTLELAGHIGGDYIFIKK